MSTSFGVDFPLWSFAEAPDLLDRIVGEIGVDRVSTSAIGGPVQQFRLAPGFARPRFRTTGGWHYPPNRGHYRHSALAPCLADWVGKRNTLDALAAFAESRALRLSLRLALSSIAALVDKTASLARRDAWGTPDVQACFSNPDLRELAREALAELLERKPVSLQFADEPPPQRGTGAGGLIHTAPAAARWADLCFCPSCGQAAARGAAHVDPDAAARSVQVWARRPAAADGESVLKDEVITGYVGAVRADFDAWRLRLAELHEGCRFLTAADAEHRPAPAGWGLVAWGTPTTAGGAPAEAYQLAVWRPTHDTSADLVRNVSEAVALGGRWIDFWGLDEANEEAIDWVRHAVRFARRGD